MAFSHEVHRLAVAEDEHLRRRRRGAGLWSQPEPPWEVQEPRGTAREGGHFDHAVSYLGQREGALHDLADDRRVLGVVVVLGLGLG